MQLLLTLAIIAVSYLLHEGGHLLAALVTGARIKRVGWRWAGPFVHVAVEPPCAWRASLNLLGGPFVHAALGLLLQSDAPVLHMAGQLNCWLLVINLVLPKSDGWQIVNLNWRVRPAQPPASILGL